MKFSPLRCLTIELIPRESDPETRVDITPRIHFNAKLNTLLVSFLRFVNSRLLDSNYKTRKPHSRSGPLFIVRTLHETLVETSAIFHSATFPVRSDPLSLLGRVACGGTVLVYGTALRNAVHEWPRFHSLFVH